MHQNTHTLTHRRFILCSFDPFSFLVLHKTINIFWKERRRKNQKKAKGRIILKLKKKLTMTTQILPPSKNQPRYGDHRHHHHHHHDNDHNDNEENSFLTKFWAVQRCDALESPVIFTNWNDCSYYIDDQQRKQQQQQRGVDDDDGDEAGIIFEEFDNIIDAVQFILPENQPLTIPRTTYGKKTKTTTTTTTTIITRNPTKKQKRRTGDHTDIDDSDDDSDDEEFSTSTKPTTTASRRVTTQRTPRTPSTTRTKQRIMSERASVDLPYRTEVAGAAANVAAMPAMNTQAAMMVTTQASAKGMTGPFSDPARLSQQQRFQLAANQTFRMPQPQQEQQKLLYSIDGGTNPTNRMTGVMPAGMVARFLENTTKQQQQDRHVLSPDINENWMKKFEWFRSYIKEFPRGESISYNRLPPEKKEKYKSIIVWQKNQKRKIMSFLKDPSSCTPQTIAKIMKLTTFCDDVGYTFFNIRPKQVRETAVASAVLAAPTRSRQQRRRVPPSGEDENDGRATSKTTNKESFRTEVATTSTNDRNVDNDGQNDRNDSDNYEYDHDLALNTDGTDENDEKDNDNFIDDNENESTSTIIVRSGNKNNPTSSDEMKNDNDAVNDDNKIRGTQTKKEDN